MIRSGDEADDILRWYRRGTVRAQCPNGSSAPTPPGSGGAWYGEWSDSLVGLECQDTNEADRERIARLDREWREELERRKQHAHL